MAFCSWFGRFKQHLRGSVTSLISKMEHHCSLCPFFTDNVDKLSLHLTRRHRHCRNFCIHCSVCGVSFRKIDSFKTHYRRKHYKNCLLPVPGDENGDSDESADCQSCKDDGLISKKEEAVYLLKLKASCNLSNTATCDVVSVTQDLFISKCKHLSKRLAEKGLMTSDISDEITASQTIFEGLETTYKQEKFFEQNLFYVKPMRAQLGVSDITKNGRCKCVYGYYVPFLSQLTVLLSMPEVHKSVHYPVSDSGDLMTDFTDGSVVQSDQQTDICVPHLRFSLYSDELEIANPIGTHRKTHKVTVFYWTLLNIQPEYRQKMHVIQLAALAQSRHLKKHGCTALLQDLCSGFIALKQGVEILVGRYGKLCYTGSLTFVLADTLAAQFMGGFKESVGPANRPCRTCEINKSNLREVLYSDKCELRNEGEHRDRIQFLQTANKRARKYWSRQWGVNDNSILSSIPDFPLTSALLHDPMHIILEGVARYELIIIIIIRKFVMHTTR